MRQCICGALLLSCLRLSASQTFEDRIWKDFQDEMEHMRKRFDMIEKYMFEAMPEATKEPQEPADKKKVEAPKVLELAVEADFVVAKLRLGELDVQKVTIEAEDDSLDGTAPLKDGSAKFYVQSGRILGLSLSRESTTSPKKDAADTKEAKNKMTTVQTSASTRVESLPVLVGNLEKTDVSYKDGVLTLKLPKVDKGGKKLVVKAS